MAYGHDDYLTDLHLHAHRVVTEASEKMCHQAVKLESLRQKFGLSGVQPTNWLLGILVNCYMISPER